MKKFERGSKINFVDSNNVLVGFDYTQNCCEIFGWSITKDEPTAQVIGDNGLDYSGFVFDRTFIDKTVASMPESYEVGGYVMFRLVNGDEQMFLTFWNHHNGYYSHGFKMRDGNAVLFNGYL